jgi:beta-phosphoglucomutase
MEERVIKAFIFDLDGVIVDTAKYHFKAWRRLANALGFDFDEKKNEELKGVSRMESLDRILSWGGVAISEDEKITRAAQKNDWYREYIQHMDPEEILEGVMPFLNACKSAGLKMAIGSASKNTPTILDRINLSEYFDAVIDGNKIDRSKPDPQVFLMGAEAMGVHPSETIVFEDAVSGVDAALAGGFRAVGIGSEDVLGHAHLVIPNFIGHTPGGLIDSITGSS